MTQDGGWETWQWDETLFSGAAPYYQQGRVPYAPGLADALQRELELDGHGRLLDVGCGPGTVALRLAYLFEEVVGLDPDAGMLAEATRISAERGVAHARWVRERAENLPAGLGQFRAITFAASFHWMDRPRVARLVEPMLAPGGAVVQVDGAGYRQPELHAASAENELPHPPPPDASIDALRRRYLGDDVRAGKSIRNTSPSGEDDVFRAAGFQPAREVVVPDGRVLTRTIDDLVAQRFSSSPSAPHLFGDRVGEFESDLRQLLSAASPSGLFAVRLPANLLRIWRPV